MTLVKICGITTFEDALFAAEAGAHMLGLNFFKKSPRYLSPSDARTLALDLRAKLGTRAPLLIGVFVNEVVGRISVTMEEVGLNFAQLSGDESVEMLRELRGIGFKAIRPRSQSEAVMDVDYYGSAQVDPRIPSLLLDAHSAVLYGGTGERADVEIALALKEKTPRLMLAGGLNPENVGEAVKAARPWGVDVASGVESEAGKKDAGKVRAFIDAVEAADAG